MRYAMIAGLVLAMVGLTQADDAANKKFLDSLAGKYTVKSMKKGGEDGPADLVKMITVEIKGTTLSLNFGKDSKDATIVIDASQKPIAIDLTPKDGPNAGKPVLGVVSIEKDTVTMCWGEEKENRVRPKDFDSTKDNKQFQIILEKAK